MKVPARYTAIILTCAVTLLSQPLMQAAEETHGKGEHKTYLPEQIEWKDGPASLPDGAQYAVLEGDPAKAGPFTMRLKAPSGYRIPPHTHPKVERVTVISGTFKLGMGRKFDEEKMESLPAGSYFSMPAGMEHFAATEGETIVQLNGIGPWDIIYINPEDDPRKNNE